MNKLSFVLVGLISLIAAISCTKTPVADISVDRAIAGVDVTINATSTSLDANTFLWMLFDGYNETGSSSGHLTTVHGGEACDDSWSFKIDTVGTYTLKLKACNYTGGCEAEKTSGFCDDATLIITIE